MRDFINSGILDLVLEGFIRQCSHSVQCPRMCPKGQDLVRSTEPYLTLLPIYTCP